MKDKLIKIINHYGIDKQLKYIHSEYFELDEAIINYDMKQSNEYEIPLSELIGSKEHIAEEIADIMVMLKQFQYYYDIKDEELEKVMEYKIDRQLERISKE